MRNNIKPLIIAVFFVGTFLLSTWQPASSQDQEDAGQKIVDYFNDLFDEDWEIGEIYDPDTDGMGFAQTRDIDGSPSYIPFSSENVNENMSVIPIVSPDNSESAIIWLINKANFSLYIEQMYIYETLGDILLSIINAKSRGVDCRVILDDGSEEHNNASADILKKHGIPVRILKERSTEGAPFNVQHNKGIIVDDKLTLISSINWSPQSLRYNRETGLIIESESVSNYYDQLFSYDWIHAVEYNSSSTPTDPLPKGTESFNPTKYQGRISATLASSPDNCFELVNDVLKNAKKSIYISVYTLSSPYLIDTIYSMIGKGVSVKLLLEKNQVSWYEKSYNRWTLMNLTVSGYDDGSGQNKTAEGLWAGYHYQHSKYAIIDGKTLILSSGNWGKTSCPKPQDDGDVDGNRDWWIIIHGNGASGSQIPVVTPGYPVLILISISTFSIGISLVILKKRVNESKNITF
ncbi:MAG: phospholipase D-like domain-containing protein [Promethearchaeota archaeon]